MKFIPIPIFLITFLLYSCSQQSSEQSLNPNGDSELALLMRQMYDDGMMVREAVMSDQEMKRVLQHEAILTAQATEPEKAGGDLYRSFANNYLKMVAQVNDPNNPDRAGAYTRLVNSCANCHRALCPGPLVRINKMVIEQ